MVKKIKRLWYEAGLQRQFVLLAVLYSVIAVLSILGSYAIGQITQNAVSLSWISVQNSMLVFVAVSFLSVVLLFWANLRSARVSQDMSVKFKSKTVESLLTSKTEFYQSLEQGDIIGRINGDIGAIVGAATRFLIIVRNLIVLALLTLALWVLDIKLMFAFLVTIPFYFTLQAVIAKYSTPNIVPWREAMGKTNGLIQDLLNNRTTIKVFRLNNIAHDWLDEKLKKSANKGTIGIGKLYALNLSLILLMVLPSLLMAIIGIQLISTGDLSLGTLVSAIFISTLAVDAMGELNNAMNNVPQLLASSERIFPIWDCEKQNDGIIKSYDSSEVAISFQNVSFSYGPQEVLRNLSFDIKAGEKVGFVGTSGSGKSTLLRLITKLIEPTVGKIEIMGIDSQDWNNEALRNVVSFVSQDTYLFNGSIYENLQLIDQSITEEESEKLLSRVYLDGLIQQNPDGIHLKIGENGSNLSGGQRQRLSIAQSLIRNTEIVLYDEVTSALDSTSEAYVQKIIDTIDSNKTQLVVAHRFSSLVNMDRILVLDKGTIVEEGTHNTLLALNGIYTSLWNQQGGGLDEKGV